MHWFDDFTKGAAGKGPTRSAVLEGIARLAAGAAIAPLATHPALADTRAARIVAGMPRRKSKRPGTITRGPCSFTFGDAASTSFTANAASLEVTIESRFSSDDSSRSAASSGWFTIDITDGGEPVVHVESKFAGWHPNDRKAPDATTSIHYGAKVRGVKHAELRIQNGRAGGTIDEHELAGFDVHGAAPDSIRLTEGRAVSIEADKELHDRLAALDGAVKRGFATCAPLPKRQHVRERRSFEAGPWRSIARAIRGVEIAQVGVANGILPGYPTGQNTGIAAAPHGDQETSNCLEAAGSAANDWLACLWAATVGGLFCPPCMVYGYTGCTSAYSGAIAVMELPGGACEQVPCSSGSPVPNSCDTTFTCCGQQECCPAEWTCTQFGFCCQPGSSVVCGSSYDTGYCCPSNTVCGSNNSCVSCPQGQIPLDGQCCSSICGSECCYGTLATCDQAKGKCVYPSFGTPTPTAKKYSFDRCTRTSGFVTCQAPNADNSKTDICCPPGVNCCAGKCCPPSQYCGGSGATLGCMPNNIR
jgi:hypothetical protein